MPDEKLASTREESSRDQKEREHVEPHPLANELVEEKEFESDAAASREGRADRAPDRPALRRVERRVGRWLLAILAGLVMVGTIAAVILASEHDWEIAIGGAIAFICVGLLYLWPVLAARGTKIVQDEQVREGRVDRRGDRSG